MNNTVFENILRNNSIPYEKQVDLKKKTWIHRGGIADYFVVPNDVTELEIVMRSIYSLGIPHLVVGCTSNLYILNSKNIPVVVTTIKCANHSIETGAIVCDCGVQVAKLARMMIKQGVSGFEYLTQLPGTVGSAICNNSSVKNENNSITSMLIDVDMITPSGIQRLEKNDLHLGFRTSDIKRKIKQGVILKARLKAKHGDVAEMEKIAKANESERKVLLEGPTNNLGCTVHQLFCNGTMPIKYRWPLTIYSKFLSFFVKDDLLYKKYRKSFLLTIAGHRNLIPYVSDKQIITFIWRDNSADLFFDEYLSFMKDVCKTDRVEIEIIK